MKNLNFDKEAWAKEQSLELAQSYLKENPTVSWNEEFLQQRFYEIIMKVLEKTN